MPLSFQEYKTDLGLTLTLCSHLSSPAPNPVTFVSPNLSSSSAFLHFLHQLSCNLPSLTPAVWGETGDCHFYII